MLEDNSREHSWSAFNSPAARIGDLAQLCAFRVNSGPKFTKFSRCGPNLATYVSKLAEAAGRRPEITPQVLPREIFKQCSHSLAACPAEGNQAGDVQGWPCRNASQLALLLCENKNSQQHTSQHTTTHHAASHSATRYRVTTNHATHYHNIAQHKDKTHNACRAHFGARCGWPELAKSSQTSTNLCRC